MLMTNQINHVQHTPAAQLKLQPSKNSFPVVVLPGFKQIKGNIFKPSTSSVKNVLL